jgi:hypothetical protein
MCPNILDFRMAFVLRKDLYWDHPDRPQQPYRALDCCAWMQFIPACISPPTFKLVGHKQATGIRVARKTAPASIGAHMITCQECGKPAMYQLSNGVLICIECVDRFQFKQNAAIIHFLLGEMESSTGGSPLEIPKPVLHHQPVTFNNIRVDHSVVGVINTGQAQAIDVGLSYVKQNGDPVLSELFQEFTQAVLDRREIDQATRKAIVEQLSFLISQLLAKPEQKRPAIVGAVFKSIKEALSAFSGLVTLWEKLEPFLRQVFR